MPAGDPDRTAVEALVDFLTPMLVRLSSDAGVFDAFGHEERSPTEVASTTGTDAATLARVLRALESRGVVEAAGEGRYRLTRVGRRLLSAEPGSLAGLANWKPWELHAWAESAHTLHTGEPSFPAHYGREYFAWLSDHPDLAAKFNETMRERTASLLDGALPLYPGPRQGTVVDVGGGNGQLLAALLGREPGLRGVLFDLPQGVEPHGKAGAPASSSEIGYGIPLDERIEDQTWLADCTSEGWVAFMKDTRIRYVPIERETVKRTGACCFCLTRGDLTGVEMANRFLDNLPAITRACQQAGPFIFAVHSDRIERLAIGDR